MAEKVKDIDELFQTAALVPERGEKDEYVPRPQRLMESIVTRGEVLEQIFGSDSSFRDHLAHRHDAKMIQARMNLEVHRRADLIARLMENTEDPELRDLPNQPVEVQYRVLVQRGLVDPSQVFDEIPETPSLCSFKTVSDALKSGSLAVSEPQQQQFSRQWANTYKLFSTRWEFLTRRPFDGNIPWIDDLVRRKAPVPLQPSWRVTLVAREAHALNAEPSAPASAPWRMTRADAVTAIDNEGGEPAENEAERRENGSVSGGECSANELLMRAGMPPLVPPIGDQPRYTFPGQLLQREDIFYDYGLVVPVEECGPFTPKITGIDMRALTSVRAIAAEVLAVIGYLENLGLASALGQFPASGVNPPLTVTTILRKTIEDFLQAVDERTPLLDIERWKRAFAEWTTVVRDAARRRLFLSRLTSQDPRASLNDLSAAHCEHAVNATLH